VYDPRDPLMTLFSPGGQQEPHDQRALDGRHDVLVYGTPALETPVEVTGPITVKLYAASSARDTDWVVKLIDVWPGGFAQELCHGILRARYRESCESPSLLEPGRPYGFTVRVNPTSNLFKAGHRIRVDVTSSDFPNSTATTTPAATTTSKRSWLRRGRRCSTIRSGRRTSCCRWFRRAGRDHAGTTRPGDDVDLTRRAADPLPWSEGDNIPWDEPAFSARGQPGRSWDSAEAGLFSDRPHICLTERVWDPE